MGPLWLLAPITLVGTVPTVLVVPMDYPATTLKDIIAQTLHFEREREQSHHTA